MIHIHDVISEYGNSTRLMTANGKTHQFIIGKTIGLSYVKI